MGQSQTFGAMEDGGVYSGGGNEYDIIDIDVHSGQSSIQLEGSGIYRQPNGRCVLALSSSSVFSPSFDLAIGRAQLESRGFQIPVSDFEIPLQAALGLPSVRRYLLFSSSLSHFIMAMAVYVVLWCGVYSTIHLYLSLTDFWLLCFSVTLASAALTSAIALVLRHSGKQAKIPPSSKSVPSVRTAALSMGKGFAASPTEIHMGSAGSVLINVSTDIRLVQVNERLIRHEVLVGVADCSHHCVGVQQLFAVHWDLSPCLGSLTDALEEMSSRCRDEVRVRGASHLPPSLTRPAPSVSDDAG
ncbi:hypothetical protein Z043_105225 [Scleropages formosus]|uniref:Uncharacterized protein n=1 Tax=Scleropages formosus TaxID=113540 RepID=A0A0P7UM39_SCLFO|nr:hypothetical protein Z043_105225 [Scleropages formosus]